jgi:hypothetical protein
MEAEVRDKRRFYTADLENAGRGYEPRKCRKPLETRKGKGTDSPVELLEKTALLTPRL